MTAEVPSDSARTKAIVIVVLAVIAFAVGVATIWYVISGSKDSATKQTEIEPAQETGAATSSPSPGAEQTATAGTGAGEQSDAGAGGQSAGSVKHRVAYRAGDAIYVVGEDGSDPRSVSSPGQGYVLSPDGRTLAVVSSGAADSAVITLVDVATGLSRTVGRGAVPIVPAWSPDSKWLAYTASVNGEWVIKGVAADGTGDAVLIQHGAMPSISTDGLVIAFKTSDQPGLDDPLLVLSAGATQASVVKDSEGALSWAWAPGPTLYFTKADPKNETAWQLWASKAGKSRKVGTVELTAPAFALGDVTVSDDGAWVAMARIGDDDYSRLAVVSTKDGKVARLTTRRDAYPYRWGSDGRILYFEGNSYQGEPSALMSVLPDGSGRRTVVTNAQP